MKQTTLVSNKAVSTEESFEQFNTNNLVLEEDSLRAVPFISFTSLPKVFLRGLNTSAKTFNEEYLDLKHIPQVTDMSSDTVYVIKPNQLKMLAGDFKLADLGIKEGYTGLLYKSHSNLYFRVLDKDMEPVFLSSGYSVVAVSFGKQTHGKQKDVTFHEDIHPRRSFNLADKGVYASNSEEKLAYRLDVVLQEILHYETYGHERKNHFNHFVQLGNRHFLYTDGEQ